MTNIDLLGYLWLPELYLYCTYQVCRPAATRAARVCTRRHCHRIVSYRIQQPLQCTGLNRPTVVSHNVTSEVLSTQPIHSSYVTPFTDNCKANCTYVSRSTLALLDPICNLKKIRMTGENRLIFELSELSRKQKNPAKIRLNTKILRLEFSWLQTISAELLNLNWNDCQREWLSSVSLTLQNLYLSVVTRSFEIT